MRGYKKYIIAMFFLWLVVQCGCVSPNGLYHTPNEEMEQQMMTVLQAVIDRDEKTIAELFCPYVREHDEQLEEKIIGMFDFIDGDIVSYDEPVASRDGGTTTPREGYIKMSMGVGINIYTSTGKLYHLGYGAYPVYKEKSDYVGITDMLVYDIDQYNSENSWPEEAVYRVYLPEMFE